MLKRELKINFKSFISWTGVLLILFMFVFAIYPSLIASDNISMIDEYVKIFPPEVVKAFNLDITSLDSAYGFLKSEGYIFVMIITGAYCAYLGSSIVVKEENDKTIEYLNSLPISRKKWFFQKVYCALFYMILMIFLIGLFNYIGLSFGPEFDQKQYFLLSITPLLSSLPIFALSLFISTFGHKTKGILGVNVGIVLVSYFFYIISEISEKAQIFKWISLYSLADVREVIVNGTFNVLYIIISLAITIVGIYLAFIKYDKKELL